MGLQIVATSADTSALEAQVAEAQSVAKAAHDVAVKAEADAQAADDRAANAQTMVRNRDPRLMSLEDVAQRFATEIARTDQVHADLQAGIDSALARAMTPGPAGADGPQGLRGPSGTDGLQGLAGAAGAAGKDGVNGAKGADGAAGLTGPAGSKGDTGAQGVPGTPADMSRVAALEAAVAALQALKVTVGFGVANLPGSLAAGATTNVVVTLSRDMGSTTYSVGYGLSGGTSLLGQLQATGVVAQTKTTVTIAVKNSGLTALLNLSTAALSVVAARDA